MQRDDEAGDALAALLATTGWSAVPEGGAAALSAALARGRAAWPELAVGEAELGAAFGAAVAGEDDPVAALSELHAADLWLATACAAGQRAAIEALDRVLSGLQPTMARIGLGRDAIEDLLQQVRARLLAASEDRPARIGSYRGRAALRSWLKVVVVRDAMRAVRRRDAPLAELDEVEVLMDPGGDPELVAMQTSYAAAFRSAFGHALAELSARDRNVLRYHLLDGLSIDELGSMYRVHRATAARWLVKIREQLHAATRAELSRSMALSPSELASVLRLIASRLDASIGAGLQP